MKDGTGTTTYTYDELDRLLHVVNPSVSGPKTVEYRYDLHLDRTKLIYPDGSAVNYTFDKANRLQGLRDWANRSTSYGYYPDGNLKNATNANGTTTQYTLDNAQHLTQIWNQSGSNTISRHTYTLDKLGMRVRVDEVLPQNGAVKSIDPSRQIVVTSGYDRLYILTSETGPDLGISYTYDPAHNRLSKTQGGKAGGTTLYSYDKADRILRVGQDNYTVDANGNAIAGGKKETYTYDQANRLIHSRVPAPTDYVYNGDGLRVRTNASQGPMDTHLYDVSAPNAEKVWPSVRQYVETQNTALKGYSAWVDQWRSVSDWLETHGSELPTDWNTLDKWVRRLARFAYLVDSDWLK